ncbi:MAG: hypothetical protein GC171_10900 [Terrimonas sp.]|nr:hypothetical protein [Terrimonas sp.]
MTGNKHTGTYSASDFEKYWQGKLSAADMHALEKAAMDDPFLADALEGYRHAGQPVNDLESLKGKLADRVLGKPPVIPPASGIIWWRIAASIILVAGIGWLVYKIVPKNKTENLTSAEEKQTTLSKDSYPGTRTAFDSIPNMDQSQGKDSNHIINLTSHAGSAKNAGPAPSGNKKADQLDPVPAEPATNTDKDKIFVPEKELARNREIAVTPGIRTEEAGIKNDSILKESKTGILKADNEYVTENRIKTATNRNAAAAIPPDKKISTEKDTKKGKVKSFKFSGRIVDADNNAIPYAIVMNLADYQTIYANSEGYFTIPVAPDSLVLLDVSSQGFASREFRLNRFDKKMAELMLFESAAGDNTGALTVSAELSEPLTQKDEKNMLPAPEQGWQLYNQYLANALTKEKDKLTNGEVVLGFAISKSGNPVNIIILQSLSPDNDQEAIRLLREGPKWQANGKNNEFRLSVRFY